MKRKSISIYYVFESARVPLHWLSCTTYANSNTAKRETNQDLSIRWQACSFVQWVNKVPFVADGSAFQEEVKHDEGADGNIEEDC
jgi:hypothetical protein